MEVFNQFTNEKDGAGGRRLPNGCEFFRYHWFKVQELGCDGI
jgi:hypothetical protein